MKYTSKLFLALFLVFSTIQAQSQSLGEYIPGSWQGVLNVGAVQLRLAINISVEEDLSLKATLDSPDQGAVDIPMGKVSLNEDSLKIEAPMIQAYYIGKFMADSSLQGEWHQAGRMFKLDLEKASGAFVLNSIQAKQGSRVELLGYGALKWEMSGNGMLIHVPKKVISSPPCKEAWAFKIVTN